MAYIPDTKSYQPCTTNDIAKRRGIYTSEVQDYLVEFTTLHPDADIQILSLSDDPKAIEAGTDVLINTTQGTFILYPDGEFELVENGKNVRRSQTTKQSRAQNSYTKAVIDRLIGIGISPELIQQSRRKTYNLVKLKARVIDEYCQQNGLSTAGYGEDFRTAVRSLDDDIRTQVIDVVATTYDIQIEGGWFEELYDANNIRQEQVSMYYSFDYLIFIPLAE